MMLGYKINYKVLPTPKEVMEEEDVSPTLDAIRGLIHGSKGVDFVVPNTFLTPKIVKILNQSGWKPSVSNGTHTRVIPKPSILDRLSEIVQWYLHIDVVDRIMGTFFSCLLSLMILFTCIMLFGAHH